MTISTAATTPPIAKLNEIYPVVDVKTGCLTEHGIQIFNQWYDFIVGMNRIIPCNATGTNVITLTTLSATPLASTYYDHDIFAFVAANTSSGSVTGQVVARGATLATVKFYKTNGSAQAGSGDVVAGSLYFAAYNDALDGGNGGLVLK